MPKIIKKLKMADFVIDEIKNMLLDGRLKEGDKLPNQIDFALQLGVSRLSLREALHTLQMKGVIVQSPKKGTTIISGNPNNWFNAVDTPLLSDVKATMELLKARSVIELAVADELNNNIDSNDINALSSLLDEMEIAFNEDDFKNYVKLDIDFHTILVKTSKNRYLINMYMTLYNQIVQFMSESFLVHPNRSNYSIEEHTEIVKNLKESKLEDAKKCIVDHIKLIEKQFIDYYKENNMI